MELSIRSRDAGDIDQVIAPTDKRRVRARIYALTAAADGLSIVFGFLLAGWMRFGELPNEQALSVLAVMLPLYSGFSLRLLRPQLLFNRKRGIGNALLTLFACVVVVLFLGFMLKASSELSRLLLLSGVAISSVLIASGRLVLGRAARRALGGSPMSNVLIVDDARARAPAGVRSLRAADLGLSGELDQPYALDRLGRALMGVDNVFVSCRPERRQAWAMALKGCDVRGELLAPELDRVGVIGNHDFAGTATLLVSTGPLALRDQAAKRALDLLIVIPALLFLAPLLVAVAVAIKLDSPGPVFFRQQRVGRGNRLFSVIKFRSMRTDQCDAAGAVSASRDDARITRVGRFIRATSIDELPQLFNILHGEMSIVGPRPHALGSLAGDQLFWEVDHRYFHRHACKPGLTGLAQVRGFRGATHHRQDLVDRLQADLEYMNGWTVWRDLSLMARTVKVVMHRNAY